MSAAELSMLWEAAAPAAALAERFQFASAEAAAEWLAEALREDYGVRVEAVERLAISSYNLLAWLATDEGPLFAKACAALIYHPLLERMGELAIWLGGQGLPVAPALTGRDGLPQQRRGHLTVGLQRRVAGDLLDPADQAQAEAAGRELGRLHRALARYPRADRLSALPSRTSAEELEVTLERMGRRAEPPAPAEAAALAALAARLPALRAIDAPLQLIHRDYRSANLLWAGGRLAAVLDWEDLGWGHRARDVAWAAVHLATRYRDWGPVAPLTQHQFIAAYEEANPLSAAERAAMPVLLAWAALGLVQATLGKPAEPAAMAALERSAARAGAAAD